MFEQFSQFVESKNLAGPGDKVLLAVSGGVDSMVMLHLFHRWPGKVAAAHCNFQLRGRASDDDENLVRKRCKELRIPLYTRKLHAGKAASKSGASVQMAARALRYEYFDKLKEKYGFACVATAHHLGDLAETVLLHLVRGTGLAGLHGIVPKGEGVIRPLLFATRDQIKAYAKKEKITWREDASNASDKYQRNKIRLKVMPVLAEINPSVLDAFRQHAEAADDTLALFREYVATLKKKLVSERAGETRIDIRALASRPGAATLLYELLRAYGFNRSVARDVYRALDEPSGKMFLAPAYRLLKDRRHLVLTPVTPEEGHNYLIQADSHRFSWDGGRLMLRKLALTLDMKKKILDGKLGDPNIAWLDADKLQFPLLLRKWKTGDAFHPLGMRGRKKLSDFFVDNKYSRVRKENTWLLLSEDKIAWVVGDRIDDRFKVAPETSSCLEILYENA